MIAISLDRLQEKFRMDNKVYWKIYAGKGMSPTRRFAQNLTVDQLDESLESLMNQLDFANTRFITIEALSSHSAKNGMCYAVDLGEDRDEKFGQQQVAGFQNPGMLPGGTGMSYQQMIQQSERIASEKVDLAISKVTAEFEMRLLKGRIEELEDQLEHGGGSIKERLTSKLVDSVPDIIAAITGQPLTAAIGKAGFEEEEEEAPEQHNRQQAKQGQPAHLSIDRMAYDVHCLQQIFPEHNMNDVLHALLEYAKKNRAQVASLINMISK